MGVKKLSTSCYFTVSISREVISKSHPSLAQAPFDQILSTRAKVTLYIFKFVGTFPIYFRLVEVLDSPKLLPGKKK